MGEELVRKIEEVRAELSRLLVEVEPDSELARHIMRALGPLIDLERELRRSRNV